MAEYKRDILVPAFDGGLLENKFVKGGLFSVKTRAQRNAIKYLYRTLDATYSTMCFVSADNVLYELVNNPLTDATSDSDWAVRLQVSTSDLINQGTWDASNTNPVLQDSSASDRTGQYYFVTGAATPTMVTYAGLFGGNTVTVKNGDMIISNGSFWFVNAPNVTWDSLDKPQVITDYVNGIVISHTHVISDVTGLQSALDSKYDSSDLADPTQSFDTVPDGKIVDVAFLRANYYTDTQVDALIAAIEAAASSVLAQASLDTSGSIISINMNNSVQRMFVGSDDIAEAKSWNLSNADIALLVPSIKIKMNTLDPQTFPSNFKMVNYAAEWDAGTYTWTPSFVGVYEISLSKDAINNIWLMKITGPF